MSESTVCAGSGGFICMNCHRLEWIEYVGQSWIRIDQVYGDRHR